MRPNGTFAVTTDGVPGQPGAWIISSGAVNAAGQPVGALPAARHLPPATAALAVPAASQSPVRCLTSHGIRVAVSYQPASHYWAFQGTETGIYLALTLVLAGYCFWRVSRHLS